MPGADQASYPLLGVFWTMLVVFAWFLWLWLLFTVYVDLFRRDDIGGWAKTGWVVFTILVPMIGVLVYLLSQGRSMQQRRIERARRDQAEMDAYIRSVAASGGDATVGLGGAQSDQDYDAMARRMHV